MSSSSSDRKNNKAIQDEALKLCIASWGEGSSGKLDIEGTMDKEVIKEAIKMEAQINKVLYGPSTRRRLPVFEEICPSIKRTPPK